MAEQPSPPRPLRQVPPRDEHEELQAELAQAREEVLRLRDLLIAKETELGALRGQLAEIKGGAAPLLMIAAKLRSLVPGFIRAPLMRLLRRGA